MCDTQITPNVATIDKLPVGARVFIDGKNRPLHVTQTPDEIHVQLIAAMDKDPLVRVTNINGEDTFVPKIRIVSVVEPTGSQRRPVQIPSGAFHGKQIRVIGLEAFNREQDEAESPFYKVHIDNGFESEADYVAIVGEDLASALILVVNPATGAIAWQNPAEPDRAVKRLVKVARLLAEADTLMVEANDPGTLPAA